MAAAEEIAQRDRDRGSALPIPVPLQNEVSQHVGAGGRGCIGDGHPDMADDARPIHVGQDSTTPRRYIVQAGGALPGGSQLAGGLGGLPFSAMRVLCIDATRPVVGGHHERFQTRWSCNGRISGVHRFSPFIRRAGILPSLSNHAGHLHRRNHRALLPVTNHRKDSLTISIDEARHHGLTDHAATQGRISRSAVRLGCLWQLFHL